MQSAMVAWFVSDSRRPQYGQALLWRRGDTEFVTTSLDDVRAGSTLGGGGRDHQAE